jgi:hypothetical protein
MTLDQCWALSRPWYDGRLAGEWRGRTPETARAALESAGLVGPFWRFT